MDEDFTRELEELSKRVQQVEGLMRQLPLLPERRGRTRDLACDLIAVARNYYRFARGDKAAIRALHLLSEQLQKARHMINDLPAEAERVFDEALGGIPFSEFEFERYAQHATNAKKRLEAKSVKKRGGRPESRAAFQVSRYALRAYETLTGKRAGITTNATERGHPRSGEFLNFLTGILKACDISASPASQAKKALAERASPFMPDDYPALLAQALEDYKPPRLADKQKTPNKTHD